MADKEQTEPSRRHELQSDRTPGQRLSAGFDQHTRAAEAPAGGPERHPLQHLQHQVGNAKIVRALASRQSENAPGPASASMLWPVPEVGAAGGPISNRLASRIYGSLGRGQPLSQGDRARWEQAYGVPLDTVRIHNDREADELSLSISASAFTLGNDIFLSKQADAMDQHLLGHEIAHVVQQSSGTNGAPSSGPLVVGAANAALEHEAETAAHEAPVSPYDSALPGITGTNGPQSAPVVRRGFLDELNLGNISGILGTGSSIVQGLAETANLPLANLAGVSAPQMTSVPGIGALGGLASVAGLYTGGRDMLDEDKPWYERGVGAMSAFGGATGLAGTISSMFGSSLFAAGGSAGLTAGAGSALTGGGAGLLTGAGAATALGSAGAVLGAGAAGYGAGRLLDEGVGALGQAITGDEQGDYTISGGLAGLMTAADQGLTSLWADPDRPAYTQTIGWQLGELLGI